MSCWVSIPIEKSVVEPSFRHIDFRGPLGCHVALGEIKALSDEAGRVGSRPRFNVEGHGRSAARYGRRGHGESGGESHRKREVVETDNEVNEKALLASKKRQTGYKEERGDDSIATESRDRRSQDEASI